MTKELTPEQFKAFMDGIFTQIDQAITASTEKSLVEISAESVKTLKEGLSVRHGRNTKDEDYANAPNGHLPYAHSFLLRDSIGMRVVNNPAEGYAEVGSGVEQTAPEYNKYLDDGNRGGKKPFLWAIKDIFSASQFVEKFKVNFKKMVER